jgi:tetratricopeptide (TPR) repeat protein
MNDAIEMFRKAKPMVTNSEQASLWLSEAYAVSGQKNKAIQVLEKDAQSRPEHLQVLIQAARYRVQLFDKDPKMLWEARKELQLALSRLSEYQPIERGSMAGDLGLVLFDPEQMRSEIQKMMDRIELKIAEMRQGTSVE